MKRLVWIALILSFVASSAVQAAEDEGVQFFEQKIRPVLVEHCYGCHSADARDKKKLQAGLYLDTAAGVVTGGESGAVIVKGKSADSLLIKALRYDGLEMPPSGKLSDAVIADFAKWIDLGAPDPRGGDTTTPTKREVNVDEGKQWWAYRPLRNVSSPDPSKPIDGFIREAQEKHGIKPGQPAAKEKLIRRAYFDLVGLPPTPEQVASFVSDSSPQAFEKVVDELLASSRYGERWARHWLDAARFAESGGYEFDGFRPGAFHYRDWVIQALNSDMPYDEFVRMQLAGDVLQPNTIEGASATGFLVAGPYPGQITAKTVERIRYDQLDDMLMTIGGSMMGMTIGCVRCHAHKYDPIPHEDYYSLAATLARTVHGTRMLDKDPPATARALEKHERDHEPLVAALKTFSDQQLPQKFQAWKKAELPKQPEVTHWQALEPVAMDAERSYLKELPGGIVAHDAPLVPGTMIQQPGRRRNVGNQERYRLTFQTHQKNIQSLRLDTFTDKSLPQRGPGLNGDGSFQLAELRVLVRQIGSTAKGRPQAVKLKPVLAAFEDKDQPLANAVDGKPGTAWIVKTNAKKDNAAIFEFEAPIPGFENGTELVIDMRFRDLGIGRLRAAISVTPNPATWAGDVSSQHIGELRAIAKSHPKELPDAVRDSLARWFAPYDPDTAKVFHAVRDHAAAMPRPKLSEVYTTIAGGDDVYFLRRGEVDNKQGKAEPGFLKVLWRGSEPPTHASPTSDAAASSTESNPRTSLADWMTDLEKGAGPLLARVMANRVWQHHFGDGIVGTPNDFGAQGEPPSHPDLLEFLAQELVRGGWKLKPLHRLIMLSETYRQSHEVDPANLKLDPENRYLWHYRPRRLEAETIRDALLSAGSNLDLTMYGPSVLENSTRRSIYLRVKRSELLPVMTMFDAPEPTQSIGERSVTTVPTQALAMMNSPFVRQQAEKMQARIRPDKDASLSSVIDRGYLVAFCRLPTDSERSQMLSFIEQQQAAMATGSPDAMEKACVEFCHVLLCLSEFVYVD